MRKFTTIGLITCVIILLLSTQLTQSQTKIQTESEETFTVLGNCYTCKVRIEGVVNNINGIDSCNWDASRELLYVIFDNKITDLHEIMLAIAAVGHDTEWYRAPDRAYAELIGTCCEYERWFNYTLISKNDLNNTLKVYPNPSSDILNITIDDYQLQKGTKLTIYSKLGEKILQKDLDSTENVIDISNYAKGNYIIVLTEDNKIISTKKINKI